MMLAWPPVQSGQCVLCEAMFRAGERTHHLEPGARGWRLASIPSTKPPLAHAGCVEELRARRRRSGRDPDSGAW